MKKIFVCCDCETKSKEGKNCVECGCTCFTEEEVKTYNVVFSLSYHIIALSDEEALEKATHEFGKDVGKNNVSMFGNLVEEE